MWAGSRKRRKKTPPPLPSTTRDDACGERAGDTAAAEEEEGAMYDLCFTTSELNALHEWVHALDLQLHQREVVLRREVDRLIVLHSIYLLPPSEHLAALDCLLSFAIVGHRYGWTMPHILPPLSSSPFSGTPMRREDLRGGPAPAPPNPIAALLKGRGRGVSFWHSIAMKTNENETPGSENEVDKDEMVSSIRTHAWKQICYGSGRGGEKEKEKEEAEVGGGGDGGVLHITGGWHPILGCAFRSGGDGVAFSHPSTALLPFDFHMHSPRDHVCVVLGLNSTGKSVLLSAIALMLFLAHLGCGVSAQHMSLPLLSSILSASPVPSATGGSSFYAECVALGRVLSHCEEEKRALRWALRHALRECFLAAHLAGTEEKVGAGHVSRTPEDAEASSASFASSAFSPVEDGSGKKPREEIVDDGNDKKRRSRLSSFIRPPEEEEEEEAKGGEGKGISAVLHYFRPSLVVIDELGKGTAPEDGRALLGSVLRYFAGHSLPSSSSSSPLSSSSSFRDFSSMLPTVPPDPSRFPSASSSRRHDDHIFSTLVEAYLHEMWRPLVLCATHFTEVLDFTRDLQLHRFAPSAAFPFSVVQLYEMQSTGVFCRRHRTAAPLLPRAAAASCVPVSSGRKSLGWAPPLSTEASRENAQPTTEEEEEDVLVDVIPTYLPYPITASQSSSSSSSFPLLLSREERYYYYMDHAGQWSGGPILGRRCGLHPRVLQLWQDTLDKLRQPTS